jgi:programmed cell death 6-interacting protein
MPNQLFIPFKETSVVPVKQAAQDYLRTYTDSHPEEFKWDINRWDELRKAGVGGTVHVDRISDAIRSVHPSRPCPN